MSKRSRYYACAAIAALGVLAGLPSLVLAQAPTFLLAWGSQGTGPGQFEAIYAVAAAPNGNVYTADGANSRIQVFTSTGEYITEWGSWGAADGQFRIPNAIAFDAAGNVCVADAGNDRIQKFTANGVFISKWGASGRELGQLDAPQALAIDATGNAYVGCGGIDGVSKFTADGMFITEWLAGYSGPLSNVHSLALDAAGNVYAANAGSGSAHVDKLTATGTPIARIGDVCPTAQTETAVNGDGQVYLMNGCSDQIVIYAPDGSLFATVGGTGTQPGQLRNPLGIGLNAAGELYVADAGNHRVQMFSSTGATPARAETWGKLKGLYR